MATPTPTPKAQAKVENVEALTPGEMQMLKLIVEGHSTKAIAGLLGVSFKTAACRRSKLLEKIGVHETASLLKWCILHGIVNP